jgi:PRTRC genetic system ThiF family protein
MLVWGHPGGIDVTLMDGDTVSGTNCVRQPFCQADIGHPKAVVQISRLNLFWAMNWHAVPEHFGDHTSLDRVDLVIGCVDTRAARRAIHERVTGSRSSVCYWLDMGNHSSGGQLVLGQPINWRNRRSAERLRTAAELFPELIDCAVEDDGPSCSAVEALDRQEPFVNSTLANHALALLARLFRYGRIEEHGAFLNVAGQRVQPLPVDASCWKRIQRRGDTGRNGPRRNTDQPGDRSPSRTSI